MRTLPILLICLGAVLLLGACWFWEIPLTGDDGSYSYRSARWISQNGMPFIPSGAGKGEQANGHPTLFFWLWALGMKLCGNTLATLRILPTIASWLALAGTWKLAALLSRDRLAGPMAAAALLASPLFLAQAFRPLPDVAFAACAVWSLFCFSKGRILPSALLCGLAVQFREQGLLLAGSLFLADLLKERRLRWRMLLWGLPVALLALHFLLNHLVNGTFFDPRHLADASDARPHGDLLFWLGHFGGHLLGEDYRWLPISAALALTLSGPGRRLTAAAGAALLAPVLLHDGNPAAYVLLLVLLGAWALRSGRRLPSRGILAILLLASSLVVFFTLLTRISPDPPHDLFRYLLGAYPGMMALLAAWLLRGGRRIAVVVWSVFLLGSLACIGAIRPGWQAEDSPLGQVLALRVREAVAASENPYLPRRELLKDPVLGIVPETRLFRHGVRGELIATSDSDVRELPTGYVLSGDTLFEWRYRSLYVLSLGMAPVEVPHPRHPSVPVEPPADR